MTWFSIETHRLPCDKSGRSMMSSQTASLFATYEADYRCIELFNMTFFKQVSPVRPMSPGLRAILERVADTALVSGATDTTFSLSRANRNIRVGRRGCFGTLDEG